MEKRFSIDADEADKVIEQLTKNGDITEVGIFISLLSHRYMKERGMTKEQFMTSLSNSIDKLENGKR